MTGRPLVKARFRPQHESDKRTVIRHLDRLGDQTIERERLVPRSFQKALEDQVMSARQHALDNEGVEVVKGPGNSTLKLAPLRRVGIHVVEMKEPGLVLGIPVHGDAVALSRRGSHTARDQNRKQADEIQYEPATDRQCHINERHISDDAVVAASGEIKQFVETAPFNNRRGLRTRGSVCVTYTVHHRHVTHCHCVQQSGGFVKLTRFTPKSR